MNHVVVQQNDHNLVILLYLIKLKKKSMNYCGTASSCRLTWIRRHGGLRTKSGCGPEEKELKTKHIRKPHALVAIKSE